MIKSLVRLVVLVLLLAGWSLAGLSLYVIRTPNDIPTLIPKDHLDWRDTYVDTTHWTIDDAAAHPELVQKLIRVGKADVLQHVIGGGDLVAQLTESAEASAGDVAGGTGTDDQPRGESGVALVQVIFKAALPCLPSDERSCCPARS